MEEILAIAFPSGVRAFYLHLFVAHGYRWPCALTTHSSGTQCRALPASAPLNSNVSTSGVFCGGYVGKIEKFSQSLASAMLQGFKFLCAVLSLALSVRTRRPQILCFQREHTGA